jgi:hypothetical protein
MGPIAGPKRARPKTAYDKRGLVTVPTYKLASKADLPSIPKWSFTKDKCQNFLIAV